MKLKMYKYIQQAPIVQSKGMQIYAIIKIQHRKKCDRIYTIGNTLISPTKNENGPYNITKE